MERFDGGGAGGEGGGGQGGGGGGGNQHCSFRLRAFALAHSLNCQRDRLLKCKIQPLNRSFSV